jgi:alanyl-tRNA synthetase
MDEQRARARKAQKKEAISVEGENLQIAPTKFLGYDFVETESVIETVLPGQKPTEFNIVLDRTPCYAEMGGQVGDHGLLHVPGHDRTEVGMLRVADTQKRGDVFIHRAALTEGRPPEPGEAVRISIDVDRRRAIERHHTVTHFCIGRCINGSAGMRRKRKLCWAGEIDLRFFERGPHPRPEARCRELVNEKIVENAPVSWTELPYSKPARSDIQQFFGEKYGDVVRVVQIGGEPETSTDIQWNFVRNARAKHRRHRLVQRCERSAIAAGSGASRQLRRSGKDMGGRRNSPAGREICKPGQTQKDLSPLPAVPATERVEAIIEKIEERAVRLKEIEEEVHQSEKKQAKVAESNYGRRRLQSLRSLPVRAQTRPAVSPKLQMRTGSLAGNCRCVEAENSWPNFSRERSDGRVDLVAGAPKNLPCARTN